MEGKDADDISAGSEKGGVPEAHHAAVSENQIQTYGGKGVNQNSAEHSDIEGFFQCGGNRGQPYQEHHPGQQNTGL